MSSSSSPALVFGVAGEQGRAVLEGLLDDGKYEPIYGFTSQALDNDSDQYLTDALGCILLQGELSNPSDVRKALSSTRATAIFLVTTTDFAAGDVSYATAQEDEYDTIMQFFTILKEVYQQDGLERTVIFSTRDNVQELCRQEFDATGEEWISPLDDGSIVPHYSAKGKAAEDATKLLADCTDLTLINVVMPFFFSNFLAFFAPLPNNPDYEKATQWELSASFGDGGSTVIDMMHVADLGVLVVNLLKDAATYRGKTLRIAAERISMNEIAAAFSDLYGKDVVYNPLLPEELANLKFLGSPCIAQMCQFLADPRSLQHDTELTKELLKPKQATTFESWLLSHSDSTVFTRVGLDREPEAITKVCVFGATSLQGKSVIQGLLQDKHTNYTRIRATTRRPVDDPEVQAILAMDPERIEIVRADFDHLPSCEKAVLGMDGAFLVSDLWEEAQPDLQEEERHTRNIIDACEGNVKHLIFATMESVEHVRTDMVEKELLEFSPKVRAAAYAKSKNLSITFVLMPCYSEAFFDMIERHVDETSGKERIVIKLPLVNDENAKVMCMSVEELGPAVARIFDAYECFAGHEVGLCTDFLPLSQVQEIIQGVFDDEIEVTTQQVESKEWVEARDMYMKDLGQMFASISHVDAVKHRHSLAKTYSLVPSARNLRKWVEANSENPAFREKLGLR